MINRSKIYKMRVVFHLLHRKPEHAYISRTLRKMILDSGLDFEPAKINNAWPRFAYGPVLPVGVTAAREYVDVYLVSSVSPQEVQTRLQAAGKGHVEILNVSRVPYVFPFVQQLATVAKYSVSGDFTAYAEEQAVENYFTSEMEVVFRAPNGLSYTQKAGKYVRSVQKISEHQYHFWLQSVEEKWFNPYALLAAALGKEVATEEGFTLDGFTVVREGLYWQDSQGEIHLI